MLSIVRACAVVGLDGELIEVQVDFNPRAAIPQFTIVGLPDSAVRESKERVRSAIRNSKMRFPNKRYVVNLSPANIPKHGPAYDLAIAIGVLASTDQIPIEQIEDALFIGELSLDGRIMHVNGVLPMVYAAQQAGITTVYVPEEDAPQAAVLRGVTVIPVRTLGELVEHLYQLKPIMPYQADVDFFTNQQPDPRLVNFSQIKGQEHIKRALEIAAAGHHNVRMMGSPGVGKSLLARAMPAILPSLSLEEAIDVTRIYSVADKMDGHAIVSRRPFQAPHHTISQAGLVGGGTIPRPGAVSLSHLGLLFLDECTEFSTKALEVLRQPIEDKIVTISRAKGSYTFPANFLLILAHNPCPCGYFQDATRDCTCTPTMINRYQSKLSGPLLDRIDIHVTVPRVDYDKLTNTNKSETSEAIKARVETARQRQTERFKDYPDLHANGDMGAGEIQAHCVLDNDARDLLDLSVRRMQLSARSYHRVLKLSRTIADLDAQEMIQVPHVAEALQYRPTS
ncbi:MAG: YifB family Mg chelatase-like AAA ATPase [Chloroflexota bacterium]